jgi:hypothetical protein
VRAVLEQEQLEDAVADVGRSQVLLPLGSERGDVEVVELAPAGELHVAPQSGGGILGGQEPGPVRRQLGLACPLVEGGDHRA